MENINIQSVRELCQRGVLRAFAKDGGVYLEDTATGESVLLENKPIKSAAAPPAGAGAPEPDGADVWQPRHMGHPGTAPEPRQRSGAVQGVPDDSVRGVRRGKSLLRLAGNLRIQV